MAKNFLEQTGRLALFRDREDPKGTPETGNGVSLDLDQGSGLGLARTIEDNRDQITGGEGPSEIYYGGHTAAGKLSQKRVKPDFLALVLAHFFGACTSTSVGTSAFRHAITPLPDLDHPSFTLVQRRGHSILKERLAGNHIEGFTLELGESWASLSAEVKGWGKREVNYFQEVISAPANSTSITLAANAVEGGDAAERLENVFRVRAKDVGVEVWSLPGVSGVSGDTPAVLSLRSAVGTSADPIDFHVDYIPQEPAWCTFPPAVDESPLKLVEAKVVVDGYYNGTDLVGGEVISADALSFSIAGTNNLVIKHAPDGSGALHAVQSLRGGRQVTIKLSEKLKNTIRQYQLDHADTERLAVALVLQGAEIDPGSGIRFGAELIFPSCGILAATIAVHDKFLAQEGDLIVLDDGVYGGAIIRCYNRQAGYLG
jgi:hypothetical protein